MRLSVRTIPILESKLAGNVTVTTLLRVVIGRSVEVIAVTSVKATPAKSVEVNGGLLSTQDKHRLSEGA